jgi:hypothetical protein
MDLGGEKKMLNKYANDYEATQVSGFEIWWPPCSQC